ncbi:hypothetical protein ACRAWF_17330 [Streptomyces sp. L7]
MFRSEYCRRSGRRTPHPRRSVGRGRGVRGRARARSTARTARPSRTPRWTASTAVSRRASPRRACARGTSSRCTARDTVAFPLAFYRRHARGCLPLTTVHPLATPEEFAKQLRDSAARWIVTVSPLLEAARRAAELAGGVEEIFVCDSAAGHRSLADMLASTSPEPVVDIDPAEDVAAPLRTPRERSASPRAVMLTHRQIATRPRPVGAGGPHWPRRPHPRRPAFFHIYGLTALMNAPLRKGAAVVVLPASTSKPSSRPSRTTASPASTSPRRSSWPWPNTRQSRSTTSRP